MPQQPNVGSVHVNRPLTNISVAWIQDQSHFVSTKDSIVPSDKRSNVYFTYTQNDWFRDEAQPRAGGTESAGGGYNVDPSGSFNCLVYAFHKDVDEQVRLNEDDPLDGKRDAIKFVTRKLLLKQEILWMSTFFAASTWTGSSTGADIVPAPKWNDPTSTPIEDVQVQQASILSKTGYLPNKLTLGFEVYQKLVRHPDIIDLIKYGASAGSPAIANEETLAKIFGVDSVMVSKGVKATNAEGGTAAYTLMAGKSALLEYVTGSPGLYEATSRYTFMWTGVSYGLGETIGAYEIPMPWLGLTTVRCEAQIAFVHKVIAPTMGVYFATAVA